jgi:thermitase
MYSDIANAIVYAADRRVRVINVSIGGSDPSSVLQSAINYAWGKGAVVFASAMNASTSTPYYPAACDLAIAVSATDSSDIQAGFSNYGTWIDLSAPGVSILTTSNGGGYGYWSGTSFSSPLTAGVAALALSVNPSLSASALVSILQRSAVDLGSPGFDQSFGWGRVNARAAVAEAAASLQVDAAPPQVTIVTPAANSTVSGAVQVAGTATDNIGVVRVEFSVDGQLAATSNSGSFSFPWNTLSAVNGAHTLGIRAYDAVSNTSAASLAVNVNNPIVADTQAPVVKIVTPLSGAAVGQKPVAITASATDNRAVVQVAIYIDEVQVYTGSTAPYSYNWNAKKAQPGTHVIKATAWDAAGNSAASAPVSVVR